LQVIRIGRNEGYPLRDGSFPYKVLSGAGNDDIGLENTYFWGVNNTTALIFY
jgi:hypothetical protein